MAKDIKIRAWMDGDMAQVKALLFHPMETGQRKDKKTGKKIPAHFIKEVHCVHQGKDVLTCLWGTGVSKNPFLSFRFRGAKRGDTLKISWLDNQGETQSKETTLS